MLILCKVITRIVGGFSFIDCRLVVLGGKRSMNYNDDLTGEMGVSLCGVLQFELLVKYLLLETYII